MFTATPAIEIEIPVLSSQTCPSLTAQSKLTYHLGLVGPDLHLRINANTGGGFFSREWLPMARILERLSGKEPFTSRVFSGLFVSARRSHLAV
jgi:hypothetical protein